MPIVKDLAGGDPVQFLDSVLMTDDVTVLIKVSPLSLFNFNSIMDNQTYADDWESWVYSDGRLAWRVDSTANSIDPGLASGTQYLIAETWAKAGTAVTTKLGVGGLYKTGNTGVWKTPPPGGMWLAGVNGTNDQGDQAYGDILVFDKVLSDAELLDAYTNFDAFYVQDVLGVVANGAVPLPSLVFSGSATDSTSEVTANGAVPLPSLVFSGSATDSTSEVTANGAITLPSLVFSGSATDSTPEVTANGAVTLPSLVFSGSATAGQVTTDYTIIIDVSIKTIVT